MTDTAKTEVISGKLRRIRLALVAITVLAAAVLIASTVLTWSAVRSASSAIVEGQARALTLAIFGSLRGRDGRPDADLLDEIVAEHAEDGLRAIAIYRPNGKLELTSSDGHVFEESIDRKVEPSVETLDNGRVRVVERRPILVVREKEVRRPRPGRGRGKARGLRGRGDRGREKGARNQGTRTRVRPGPPLVMEFEPVLADELRATATQTLIAGGIAGVLLAVVAFLLWRSLLARERTERKLREERHLASIGHMSATLAHEIRNPLASLKGHAQLLEAQLPPGSREQAKAQRLVGDVVRLEELTTGLLEFVKSNKIQRTEEDVTDVVTSAIEASGATNVELHAQTKPGVWSLDRNRVVQALVNLLQNAAQASGEEAVDVEIRKEAGQLVLSVRDRGEGVPADPEPLFEPFFTTRTRGTGLGLPMARQIARAHGGDITARNHRERGAVFEMRLAS